MKHAIIFLAATLLAVLMAQAKSDDITDGNPYWIMVDGRVTCGYLSSPNIYGNQYLEKEQGISACRTYRGSFKALNSTKTFCGEWTEPDGWLIQKLTVDQCM